MAFTIGQRVLFCDRKPAIRNAMHMASMGLSGVVMHLNATDQSGGVILPISGVVLKISKDAEGSVYLEFKPDGWLIAEGDGVQGFQMDSKYFKPYPEDEQEFPGRVTDNSGKPVTSEQIEAAFEKRRVLREESKRAEEYRTQANG